MPTIHNRCKCKLCVTLKEYRSRTKNYSPPITHDLCSSKLCISLKDKRGIHGESLSALLPFISLKQRWDIQLEFL